MNIFSLVHKAVGVVSPRIRVSIQVNQSSVTSPDGSRKPTLAPPQMALVSIQALQFNDITQADALNIQGVRRKMYVYGEVDGLVRVKNKGGDIVTLPDGTVWKVAIVAESWPEWTSCIITLQNE